MSGGALRFCRLRVRFISSVTYSAPSGSGQPDSLRRPESYRRCPIVDAKGVYRDLPAQIGFAAARLPRMRLPARRKTSRRHNFRMARHPGRTLLSSPVNTLQALTNGMDRVGPSDREGHPVPWTFDRTDNAICLNHLNYASKRVQDDRDDGVLTVSD